MQQSQGFDHKAKFLFCGPVAQVLFSSVQHAYESLFHSVHELPRMRQLFLGNRLECEIVE